MLGYESDSQHVVRQTYEEVKMSLDCFL